MTSPFGAWFNRQLHFTVGGADVQGLIVGFRSAKGDYWLVSPSQSCLKPYSGARFRPFAWIELEPSAR